MKEHEIAEEDLSLTTFMLQYGVQNHFHLLVQATTEMAAKDASGLSIDRFAQRLGVFTLPKLVIFVPVKYFLGTLFSEKAGLVKNFNYLRGERHFLNPISILAFGVTLGVELAATYLQQRMATYILATGSRIVVESTGKVYRLATSIIPVTVDLPEGLKLKDEL